MQGRQTILEFLTKTEMDMNVCIYILQWDDLHLFLNWTLLESGKRNLLVLLDK